LADWTNDVIQKHVDLALARTRKALRDAVASLQEIAKEIARSEMPSEEEAGILLRNVPRFEIASVPHPVGAAFWRWLGHRTAAAFARHGLRRRFAEVLNDELRRYGQALSQWSRHATRSMEVFVSSYADAYRAQLGRMRGQSADTTTAPELENDLALLLMWSTETEEIPS
jgi:hypothetical protein